MLASASVRHLLYLLSNDDGVPSSRNRWRKTGGGQALGTFVARIAVAAAAAAAATAVVTAGTLPRPQKIISRGQHRVVQIILQVVRRRRQVSRNLRRASHRPRHYW